MFKTDAGSVKSCRISKDEDLENDFGFGIRRSVITSVKIVSAKW